MTNIRPRQLNAPRWPWKNRILNGYPTVVEREPAPWMPELVSCYDWTDLEEQRTPYPGEGRCSRDMKSIFTTAVRMYGYERLYLELSAGNNVFALIGGEMRRWLSRLLAVACIDWVLIGDDIAHNGGLFMPPALLQPLFGEYQAMRQLGRDHGALSVYHSDGDVTGAWPQLSGCADKFLFQKSLVRLNGDRILDHTAEMEWASYPVREQT